MRGDPAGQPAPTIKAKEVPRLLLVMMPLLAPAVYGVTFVMDPLLGERLSQTVSPTVATAIVLVALFSNVPRIRSWQRLPWRPLAVAYALSVALVVGVVMHRIPSPHQLAAMLRGF
jgi:hypothetical protein